MAVSKGMCSYVKTQSYLTDVSMVEFLQSTEVTTTQNGAMKWDLVDRMGPFRPNPKQFLNPTGGYIGVQVMMSQTSTGAIIRMEPGSMRHWIHKAPRIV